VCRCISFMLACFKDSTLHFVRVMLESLFECSDTLVYKMNEVLHRVNLHHAPERFPEYCIGK
jgi:hypothetical protein